MAGVALMIASAAAPTFHVTAQLSLTPLMNWAKDKKLSFTMMLARACARAISENPLFNASYTDEGLAHFDQIDIGIAVDMPDGLITPVLRDVGRRTIGAFLYRAEYELYDLEQDPDELVNLADDPAHAALKTELMAELDAFQRRTKDPWAGL